MEFEIYPENQDKFFSRPYIPVWANVDVFEQLFSESDSYFPPGKYNRMKSGFFPWPESEISVLKRFYCGRASLGDNYLYFSSGKHRSRWLIDIVKVEMLPIAIDSKSLDKAGEYGLINSFLTEGDKISLPVTVKEIVSNHIDHFGFI